MTLLAYLLFGVVLFVICAVPVYVALSGIQRSAQEKADAGMNELRRLIAEYEEFKRR